MPLLQQLIAERESFAEIARASGLRHSDLPMTPHAAQRFAEDLLMCLTKDQAKTLMIKDQVGAQSFWELSARIEAAAQQGAIKAESPPPREASPFYTIAASVKEYSDYLMGREDEKP